MATAAHAPPATRSVATEQPLVQCTRKFELPPLATEPLHELSQDPELCVRLPEPVIRESVRTVLLDAILRGGLGSCPEAIVDINVDLFVARTDSAAVQA